MQETYHELDVIAGRHPEAGVEFIPAVEYFDSADPASFLSKENGYIDWSSPLSNEKITLPTMISSRPRRTAAGF